VEDGVFNMTKKYKKVRNKISRKRKKKHSWEYIKDPVKRAKAKAEFEAQLITFNRSNHPSTKFKGITNYADVQKNLLTNFNDIAQKKLKNRKNPPSEL